MCLDVVISGPAEALGFFAGLVCLMGLAWHVERAIRRRVSARRDREWYKRPPKKSLR